MHSLHAPDPAPVPPRLAARWLAAVAALLASSVAMAIEEPGFRVLDEEGAFELREYAPHLVAETRVEASFTAAGKAWTVAFVVPAKYSLDTVPQPRDPRVEIRAVPAQLVASWRYSGRWTVGNYRAAEARLREQIAKRGLEAGGEPILARYDPPFMPAFMRRNEVLIPVERSAAR